MTKYIVSGYIGFDNFGDEAIAKCLIEKLKQEDAEKITLISSNPKKTEEIHGVHACKMLGFIPDLIKSDVLISGGGSLLQDITSRKSLIYYLLVIYTALFFRKKVEIFSQGIGPLTSKIGKFLTKIALKYCSKVSVRDKKSQEYLANWGIKAELVKDPVLEMNLEVLNKKGIVGVQLRDFPTLNTYFISKLAEEISKRFVDKKVQIFSLQDSIDLIPSRKLEEMIKANNPDIAVEILSNLSVADVFEKLSELEYLIAMRFHANVVGIRAGVKTAAINYDVKVQKLAEEYNLPLIKMDGSNLCEELNKLF